MARRDDIQGLRAVAVLLVALGHADVPFLRGGYVGVDVFFVLSGFLITGILLAEAERRGSISLAGFYVRRARRILPAAALTLLATDLAARHLLNFVRAREVVSDSIWAAAFGANGHFARLAIAAPRLRVPAFAGWIGLAAIAAAVVGFSSATPFPGYAALLPTAGAALVIVAGVRALSVGPLRYIGDRSYAFYLWHWPVLVIAPQYVGHPLAVGVKLVLLVAAFGLSVVSYRLVEDPIRRATVPMRVGALVGPACAAAVLVTAVVLVRSLGATAARVDTAAAAVRPTALVDPAAVVSQTTPKPLPAVVAA